MAIIYLNLYSFFNRYGLRQDQQISENMYYNCFLFSFDATLTPDITELFSSSISTSDTREDIEFVDVFIAISWVVISGILFLFIRRILK